MSVGPATQQFDPRAPDRQQGEIGAGPQIPDRSLPQGEKTDESQGLNRASDPMRANGPKNAHRRCLRPVRQHPAFPASGRGGTLREQPTAAVGRPWEPGRWATPRGSLRPDRGVRISEMEPPRRRTATRDGTSGGGPNRGDRGIECRRSHDTRGWVSHGSRRTGCRGDLHRGPAIATLVVVRRFSFSLLCKIEDSWGSHPRIVSVPHGLITTACAVFADACRGDWSSDKLLPVTGVPVVSFGFGWRYCIRMYTFCLSNTVRRRNLINAKRRHHDRQAYGQRQHSGRRHRCRH